MKASALDSSNTRKFSHRIGLSFLAIIFCATDAPSSIPEEKPAEAELLALHQCDRRAHFTHDVEALLATLPPEFVSLRDGNIRRQSQDELRKRFTEYFRVAEFTAWDDLEPPIAHVSPDSQMGWMIVRVKRGQMAARRERNNDRALD
jgi:hypothetical protein